MPQYVVVLDNMRSVAAVYRLIISEYIVEFNSVSSFSAKFENYSVISVIFISCREYNI